MRRYFAVLALAAFVAACSDQPTQPSVEKAVQPSVGQLQFAKFGADNGAWAYRFPLGCQLWGYDGTLIDTQLYPMKGVYAPNGVFSWQCWVDKIPNPTGKTIHFGPDHTVPANAYFLEFFFGITPINGRLPNCDIDMRRYPDGYAVVPIPETMKPNIQCTWNWHYTITASGEARFTAVFDPGNSWYPYR